MFIYIFIIYQGAVLKKQNALNTVSFRIHFDLSCRPHHQRSAIICSYILSALLRYNKDPAWTDSGLITLSALAGICQCYGLFLLRDFGQLTFFS